MATLDELANRISVLENFIKNAKNRNDMGYVQGIP